MLAQLWRRICVATALLALAVCHGGCAHLTTDVGAPLPPRASVGLTVGESTVGNVTHALGPPTQMSALPGGGCAMLYEHNFVSENQIGFYVPYGILAYLKLAYGQANLSHQCWTMTFDSQGVLRSWGEERHDSRLGRGFGAQLLVSAKGLVDTSDVRDPAMQQEWGMECLHPLPQTLNEAQSLTSGASGVEQNLTPTGVGQRVTEMNSD